MVFVLFSLNWGVNSKVPLASLQAYDRSAAVGTSEGGVLWQTAQKQAKARLECPNELLNMASQVVLDYSVP